jgi:hypothetical protein
MRAGGQAGVERGEHGDGGGTCMVQGDDRTGGGAQATDGGVATDGTVVPGQRQDSWRRVWAWRKSYGWGLHSWMKADMAQRGAMGGQAAYAPRTATCDAQSRLGFVFFIHERKVRTAGAQREGHGQRSQARRTLHESSSFR